MTRFAVASDSYRSTDGVLCGLVVPACGGLAVALRIVKLHTRNSFLSSVGTSTPGGARRGERSTAPTREDYGSVRPRPCN